jgi:hypothetical protein
LPKLKFMLKISLERRFLRMMDAHDRGLALGLALDIGGDSGGGMLFVFDAVTVDGAAAWKDSCSCSRRKTSLQ